MKLRAALQNVIKNLPVKPGVYRFFDDQKHLLYIGKAANLRRRVRSYWQKTNGLYPREFVEQITKIETITTDSVIEALILEANEINARQPPYNVRQKDDKTFVMIGMTNELFPAVIVTRPTQRLKVSLKYQFGPYTSADHARIALKIIRKILPFRTTCKVPKSLTLPTKHFSSVIREVLRKDEFRGCLDFQLGLCPGPCAGAISKHDYAKLIAKIRLFLLGRKQQLQKTIEREMKQAAKLHQFELAAQLRNQLFALRHIQDVALLRNDELRITNYELRNSLRRIEGYDISNIGPNYAVGSMVVLTKGTPDKPEYRKFQIKTVVGQNDLKMMEEVLVRRFRHLEWRRPDLLVVDGGAEHLKVAQKVLKAAKLPIPIIAVAKGPKRDRLDLYPSDPELRITNYELRRAVATARDEAHRFAIRYHRARRTKSFLGLSPNML